MKRLLLYLKDKLGRGQPETDSLQQNIEEEMLETLERASTDGSIDLEEDEREMISSIFELGDTEVREVMVPRIDTKYLSDSQTLDEIRDFVAETGHSRFPLIGEDIDNILGVVYVKDIYLNSAELREGNISLRSLARKPLIVPERKKLDELLRDMKLSKNHFAVVIDEYGGTAGIVTMEDVLEEIVGEIEDEYDFEVPPITKVKEGHYIVDANLSIEELNEEIDTGVPDGEFETVGGFIYDQVGSLPNDGQMVKSGDTKFIVDKMSGQRIISVRVIRDAESEMEGELDAEDKR
ncbi:MAG: CBS domain-containing protein [candidate division Zixibacteria bacterium]|nr:CBS domain-containing protein [candidate division Zixibacteria bacterium]